MPNRPHTDATSGRCGRHNLHTGRCVRPATHEGDCHHERQPAHGDAEAGLCSAEYPTGRFAGARCTLPVSHFGPHRRNDGIPGTTYQGLRWPADSA